MGVQAAPLALRVESLCFMLEEERATMGLEFVGQVEAAAAVDYIDLSLSRLNL